MMKLADRHNFIVLFVLFALAGMTALSARKPSWDDQARQRKAAYIYIQSLDAFLDSDYDLYGELLNRAYCLDPDDPELSARLGEWLVNTQSDDSTAVRRGFAMMLDSYYRRPSDYYEALQLLQLTQAHRRWDDNLRIARTLHEIYPEKSNVTFQTATSYLMRALTGDTTYYRPAVALLDSLEMKLGKSSRLSELKINAFAARRDTSSIIRELTALQHSAPADPYTALTVGKIYNSISRPDSALRYFNRACELDSANGMAILTRAQFLRQQGDSLTFDREVFRALKSRDLELSDKLQLIGGYVGMLYSDSTQYQRIDNLFDVLLDVNPGEYDVHRLYAAYLAQIGKFERAADQLDYALALDGSDSRDWMLLLQLLINSDNKEKAAVAAEKAASRFPDYYPLLRVRAYLLSDGRDAEIIRLIDGFDSSTLDNPEDISDLYAMKGDAYYKIGNRDSAFIAYHEALKVNPMNYGALNNVAYHYAECDTLLDQAEAYIIKVVSREPDNPTSLDTYAWVLYKQGRYADARRQIDHALKYIRSDETADSALAVIDSIADSAVPPVEKAQTDPHSEEFEEEFEEDDAFREPSAEIYDHAGDIYYKCGLVDRAVSFWQKALDLDPDDPQAIRRKIKNRKILKDDP